MEDSSSHPHRRYNPLTKEYVLVSPHRNKRPWLGQTETQQVNKLPEYDPSCFLCPGNSRICGTKNPVYTHTTTFDNDFAAVLPTPNPEFLSIEHPLLVAEPVTGDCDVLCFHPRHDLTLAQLAIPDIERVIEEWINIYNKRGKQEGIKYVQIFENKGAMMGCSNPHPHGQVWSVSTVPTIPYKELESMAEYAKTQKATADAPTGPDGRPCLLCEYIRFELSVPREEGRMITANEHWAALVPWWATWPFEALVLPHHRHISSITQLRSEEKTSFARVLSGLTKRYDNLFSCSFAYSMGIHQRPIPAQEGQTEQDGFDVAHLHLHFDPPLVRSSAVRKFLVGFELMAEAQRDLTPEQAARRLRALPEVHYLEVPEK